MNKIIFFVISILLIASSIGFYFWYSKNKKTDLVQPQPSSINTTLPTPITKIKGQQNEPQDTGNTGNTAVINDFKEQIMNSVSVRLYETKISSGFAIQNWGDDNKAGQALLQENQSGKWVLITLGGGAWTSSDLVKFGVPYSVAEDLLGQ